MTLQSLPVGVLAPRATRCPRIDPRLRDVVRGVDGYSARYNDLVFIVSEGVEQDRRWWIHASVSRRDRQMPTYDDLMALKRLTIGPNRIAIQVFVQDWRHMDIAGKRPRPVQVLHLWSPEENFLPDFTWGGIGL